MTDARPLVPAYPALVREYDAEFRVDDDYRAGLPDLQNGPASLIVGARAPIQHVGISNFRLPIRYQTRAGGEVALETSVTGTVSLDADRKGINMSRIMRSFYGHSDHLFSLSVLEAALDDYKADLDAFDARIQMRFSYPVRVESLRSGLSGWQFYDIAQEVIERKGERLRIMHFDYVYSSTCPCSLELSEHGRESRSRLATPHSQRSIARISLVMAGPEKVWFEDAVRAFAKELQGDPRIGDFRVVASHQESLHSHDAVSLLVDGPTFAQSSLDPMTFESLRV